MSGHSLQMTAQETTGWNVSMTMGDKPPSWRDVLTLAGTMLAVSVGIDWRLELRSDEIMTAKIQAEKELAAEADSTLQAQIDQIVRRLNARFRDLDEAANVNEELKIK